MKIWVDIKRIKTFEAVLIVNIVRGGDANNVYNMPCGSGFLKYILGPGTGILRLLIFSNTFEWKSRYDRY